MQSKDKIMEKEKMQQYADKLRQFVMGHTEDVLKNRIAALEKENKELKEEVDNLTHLVMKEQRKEVTK